MFDNILPKIPIENFVKIR